MRRILYQWAGIGILSLIGWGVGVMPTDTSWIPSSIIWGIAFVWLVATLIYLRRLYNQREVSKVAEGKEEMIIKDSKFKAKVKRAEKASAMEVNTDAELSNVEANLEAEDVKDAAAFRTNQGLHSNLIVCSCGKSFSHVYTGRSTKATVKCPNCGQEYPVH